MTITFRVEDGITIHEPLPAIITPHQLGAPPEYGTPSDPAFSFDARVCPIALAALARCFDFYTDAIAVIDEAQFRGRRVRVWRADDVNHDILFGLSANPDEAPELNVANGNAYALLETLGLPPKVLASCPCRNSASV